MNKFCFILLNLLFSGSLINIYSQVCESKIISYNGPTNSQELEILLNTSKNKVITALSYSVKKSLLQNMEFSNSRFKSFKQGEKHFRYLSKTKKKAVLRAILNMKVLLNDFKHLPKVLTIDMANNGLRIGDGWPPVLSFCENCQPDVFNICCAPPGTGCADYLIVGPNRKLYRFK